MEKRIFISELEKANSRIADARKILMETLTDVLGEKIHNYKKYTPYVTDEEECDRLEAISINKDEVTLVDGSTMDIGDVGTDDLHSLIQGISIDIFD